VAGIGTATFTVKIAVNDVQPLSQVGITDLTNSNDVLDVLNPAFATYQLKTSIGPVSSETPFWEPGIGYNTTRGAFVIDNVIGNATFTAVTSSTTPGSRAARPTFDSASEPDTDAFGVGDDSPGGLSGPCRRGCAEKADKRASTLRAMGVSLVPHPGRCDRMSTESHASRASIPACSSTVSADRRAQFFLRLARVHGVVASGTQ
jgi:hypothetical protein